MIASETKPNPTILTHAFDLPNLITLTGLAGSFTGLYAINFGHYNLALALALFGTICDWFDGYVARRMKGRSREQGAIGANLDSLCDTVSFGVFPAWFFLSFTGFQAWAVIPSCLFVCAVVTRLSYFNVFGLIDGKYYYGLSCDHNMIALGTVFLLQQIASYEVVVISVAATLVCMAYLNVCSIKFPKAASGASFWTYILFLSVLTLAHLNVGSLIPTTMTQ